MDNQGNTGGISMSVPGLASGQLPAPTQAYVPPAGAGVSQAGAASAAYQGAQTPPSTQSYHQLGGFLAFIVYGSYVGAGLLGIYLIYAIVQLSQLFSLYSAFGGSIGDYVGAGYVVGMVLLLICYGAAIAFVCWLATMIKNRNHDFLKVYHYVYLSMIVIIVILQLIVGSWVTAIVSLVFYLLVAFFYTLYFAQSVRVRVYFGSDEYLRRSPITKNIDFQNMFKGGAGSGQGSKGAYAPVNPETAPFQAKIQEIDAEMERRFSELGRLVYRDLKDGRNLDGQRYQETADIISVAESMRDEIQKHVAEIEQAQLARAMQLSCPRCGAPLKESDRFCIGCGASVETAVKSMPAVAGLQGGGLQRTCLRCGQVLHEGDTFCCSCGAKVEAPAPEALPEPLSGEGVCKYCGSVLDTRFKFCIKCGKPA